ncbi:hypothetical protein [Methylogaea oryzae]|uniref:hypothetical protein n=1 Tax=Methylogaea oryzae TaxID=1295382 RepID=UPI00138EE578|nr:hypothetical protein [Methylogaea oryzae]
MNGTSGSFSWASARPPSRRKPAAIIGQDQVGAELLQRGHERVPRQHAPADEGDARLAQLALGQLRVGGLVLQLQDM